ncbi:hypothetical protein EYF80_014739 [Liparis tanakae]|uniref:Uncharacterized protein n=1 Tax=Liparis tanakae TaxID=230148 RepID=A0A4Z2ICB8_9TELE|nr:hypothetical protein EYF80_014739 [Liparis tanakae]
MNLTLCRPDELIGAVRRGSDSLTRCCNESPAKWQEMIRATPSPTLGEKSSSGTFPMLDPGAQCSLSQMAEQTEGVTPGLQRLPLRPGPAMSAIPLYIIDEASSARLFCHSLGCGCLWAAAVAAEGDQLMPGEENRDRSREH